MKKYLLILVVTLFGTMIASGQNDKKEVIEVESMIKSLVKTKNSYNYAESIVRWSNHYNIDSMLVVALIMTESSFRQDLKSYTGDIGLGQVNPRIWKKEFKRLGRAKLDIKKLSKNYDYNIHKTVEILSILKDNSLNWIGKYHSKTPSLRSKYFNRISSKLDVVLTNKATIIAALD